MKDKAPETTIPQEKQEDPCRHCGGTDGGKRCSTCLRCPRCGHSPHCKPASA